MSAHGLWTPGREGRPSLLEDGRGQPARRASESRRLVERLLDEAGIQIGGPEAWDLHVHDERFYRRVLAEGSLGFGESYLEGWWDCRRIDQLVFRIMQADLERHVKRPWRARLMALRGRMLNLQTRRRAFRVATVHYDREVQLFEQMLGPTMVYSCAYWKAAADLDRAQQDKLDLVCRKLRLGGKDAVLDIGCGWGGFMRHAAGRVGCHMTGLTISRRQHAYARDFCKGLPARVLLSDYRARLGIGRPFDKVACVGMFEHVGRKNYRQFMEIVHGLLPEGGLFLLQTVGRSGSAKATEPWIEKYVFPNGMLPSAAEITDAARGLLVIEDWHTFDGDYDRTLMAWQENFARFVAGRESALGEGFCRMWRYYLLSFAGNFRTRRGPQLWQVVFSKNGVKGGYAPVR